MQKPTVYDHRNVYDNGGGGGGGNNPVTPVFPDGIKRMEYYSQAANAAGIFVFSESDNIWIDRNDIVYAKFEIDLTEQKYAWRLYECDYNGFELSLIRHDTDQTEFYEYNMTDSRGSHYPLNIPAGNLLQYVIRTNQGFESSTWSISRAAAANCPGVFMKRIFVGNRTAAKFYGLIVADENNMEKYRLQPVFNVDTNKVGLIKTDTQQLFYPNSQSGFTAGPLIPF